MALLPIITSILPSVVGAIANSADQRRSDRRAREARETALADDASRFQRLRDGAVAAGFNPLTALQYGGTTSIGASGVGPVLSSAHFWQDGFASAMSEVDGRAAAERQQAALNARLTELAIESAEAELRAGLPPLSSFGGGAAPRSSSGGVADGFNQAADGSLSVPSSGPGQHPQIIIGGVPVDHDFSTSATEDFEAVYGDLASWVYGLGKLGADLFNAGRNELARRLPDVVSSANAALNQANLDQSIRLVSARSEAIAQRNGYQNLNSSYRHDFGNGVSYGIPEGTPFYHGVPVLRDVTVPPISATPAQVYQPLRITLDTPRG